MSVPAARPLRRVRPALCALLAVFAHTTQAATFLQTTRDDQQAEETLAAYGNTECISAAAGLAPCLAVVTPLSGLTTAEEATCCETLLEFKDNGCFCLGGGDTGWTAYDRRVVGLAAAYERCTSEAVACPVSVVNFGETLPLRAERRTRVSASLKSSSKVGRAGHLNVSIRNRGFSYGMTGDSLMASSIGEGDAFEFGVGSITELAALLASQGRTRVDITVEVTVGVEDDVPAPEQVSVLGRLAQRARAQPLLYGSLAVAIAALVALCFVRSRESGGAGAEAPSTHSATAAPAAAAAPPASKGNYSSHGR